MKIAIIGAGSIGGNLTRRLTALGHEVTVADSRGPETLVDLATEIGATALPVEQVARDAWVSRQLGVPVVQAFDNVHADHLVTAGRPPGHPDRAALPVAGDDPEAQQVVLALLDELGFDGVDAGPLSESWRQQPGTAVYGTDLPVDRLAQALADAQPGRTAEWRAWGSRDREHLRAVVGDEQGVLELGGP